MSEALRADSVSFTADGATLVDRVSFEVGAGQVVAVVGPNGAGKSTLVRALAGDLPSYDGSVFIGGAPLADLSLDELAAARAVLLQETDHRIPFTVGAVVAFGRYPHRRNPGNSSRHDAEVVRLAMELMDIAHLGRRIFATLSAGERARVSLARVLAQDTPLMLLDEPTATMDVSHQEVVLGRLRAEAAAGRAVCVVLHDLNAAAAYADRILMLRNGAAVADGPPADVLTSSLLSDVYQQEMRVVEHPFRDCPLVLVAG